MWLKIRWYISLLRLNIKINFHFYKINVFFFQIKVLVCITAVLCLHFLKRMPMMWKNCCWLVKFEALCKNVPDVIKTVKLIKLNVLTLICFWIWNRPFFLFYFIFLIPFNYTYTIIINCICWNTKMYVWQCIKKRSHACIKNIKNDWHLHTDEKSLTDLTCNALITR